MATTEKKETKETIQKEKMVTINLPKTRANEDDERVWVNNRSWQIRRGVDVEVPECVAEVLRHKQEALDRIMLFKEANTNN
jgi:hypothetical protein